MFRDSRRVEIPLRYSRGLGHARLCHLLADGGADRVLTLFLPFLLPHGETMALTRKQCSLFWHTFEMQDRFLPAAPARSPKQDPLKDVFRLEQISSFTRAIKNLCFQVCF
jgi:hypothetical protein